MTTNLTESDKYRIYCALTQWSGYGCDTQDEKAKANSAIFAQLGICEWCEGRDNEACFSDCHCESCERRAKSGELCNCFDGCDCKRGECDCNH